MSRIGLRAGGDGGWVVNVCTEGGKNQPYKDDDYIRESDDAALAVVKRAMGKMKKGAARRLRGGGRDTAQHTVGEAPSTRKRGSTKRSARKR